MATSTIPNLNLSFDTTPTSGSSKPVTSNGIYNAIRQSTAFETITDFNTFKPLDSTQSTRRYGLCTGDSAAHAPFSGNNETFRGYVEGTPSYFTQHFTSEYSTQNSKEGRVCVRVCINGTFLPWRQVISALPLAEVEPNGGTLTITVGNYTIFKLTVVGWRNEDIGVALITCGTSGNRAIKWIGDAPSNIAISGYTNGVITVTNNDTSATNKAYVSIEQIRGANISI